MVFRFRFALSAAAELCGSEFGSCRAVFSLLRALAHATTINAASPLVTMFTAVILGLGRRHRNDSSRDSYDWTSKITVTKGITIEGQTTTDSDRGHVLTIKLLSWTISRIFWRSAIFRLHDQHGSSASDYRTHVYRRWRNSSVPRCIMARYKFKGISDQLRIDHCHFTGGLLHNNYIAVYSTIYGVADHIVMDHIPSQTRTAKSL